LREEVVPKVEGKLWVSAAAAGNEVILKSLNRLLCGVAIMEVGPGKSKIKVFVAHVCLEGNRGVVVKFLEVGSKPVGGEKGMHFLVGGKDGGASAISHGLGIDVVAIIVLEDE
jgi:hypothetical protein